MSRFEEIEAFVRIAHSGSISGAARVLRVAKSAVSRRLSDLEARLGVQLFARTTRSLSLTDAGARFLKRAEALLEDIEEAEGEASAAQTELAGTLKIAAPLSFGLIHLQPLISEFVRNHPKVDVEIDFSDRRVDLVSEGFDIAVRIGVLTDSSLIARKLCRVRSIVAASPDFWRKYGHPKHPHDLAKMPCVRYSNVARPGVVSYWGPKGESGAIEPPIRLLANNGEFLMAMTQDGAGFVIEPTFFLHGAVRQHSLELALLDYEWMSSHLHVVYPPTRQVSARVRAFADAVVAKFNNNPYWDEGLGLPTC